MSDGITVDMKTNDDGTVEIRFSKTEHGIAVWSPLPLNEFIALTEGWEKEYGYDLIAADISTHIGAVMVLSDAEGLAKWRAEIFKEVDAKARLDARIEQWTKSGRCGLSSICIWEVLSGKTWYGRNGEGDIPHDPADWLRCHKLLQAIPEWYARLHEVSDKFPDWKPLVDAWGDLEDLYEEETAADVKSEHGYVQYPKLYARMRELTKGD